MAEPDLYDDFCPTCDAPEPTHTAACAVPFRANEPDDSGADRVTDNKRHELAKLLWLTPLPATAPEHYDLADVILKSDWLAERDREVAAKAADAFAEIQEQTTAAHSYAMDETDWEEHRRFTASIRAYAAAIRSGRVQVSREADRG